MTEDEEKPRRERLPKPPLDPLGVGELEEYIAELKGEIVRCEAAITRKQDHRSAADRFFKPR